MSDEISVASVMAAASQSLRDTAKWLVGGVVATAAGVFAGSSLTTFGSLDPESDRLRLLLAICGLLAGFSGLSCILGLAVRVLTRESMTFRELASSNTADKPELRGVRQRLLERYRDRLPVGSITLEDYVKCVDDARKTVPQTQATQNLLARAKDDNATITADASFLIVRARFQQLIFGLSLAAPVVVGGFGLFAWAANPPKCKVEPPSVSFTIERPVNR